MAALSRHLPRSYQVAFATLTAVPCCGCTGDDLPHLLPVAGSITFEGKPLAEGSVSFRADGSEADARFSPTGPINAAGRYQLYVNHRDGCPAGKYRVVVFANEPWDRSKGGHAGLPKSIIPRKYNDPQTTPLRVVVHEATKPGSYDLSIEK